MSDLLIIAVCAIVWWIPTFLGLTDLQGRQGLPRPTVWKWTAVLAVPVVGAIVYFWRGRATLDAKHTDQGAR
ncbi:hypothetical protein BH23ACT10_BH23ACT10_38290 [soil metagenome]